MLLKIFARFCRWIKKTIDKPHNHTCTFLLTVLELAKDGPISPSYMMTSYSPVVDEVCLGYHEGMGRYSFRIIC